MINDNIEHDVCWDNRFHRNPARGELKINIKERTFSIKSRGTSAPEFDFYKILLCLILDKWNLSKAPFYEKKDDGETISITYDVWGYDSDGKSQVFIAADGSYEISEIETPSNFSI